ncbi:MAG: hypothetical protein ACXVB4_08690 [Pseudobdellovibrionaceae bacterium]
MNLRIRIHTIKGILFLSFIFALIFAYQNCSKTKFSSTDSSTQPSTNTPASQPTGEKPPDDNSSNPIGTTPGNDSLVLCPLKSTNILIIDLKFGGWWEGDGAGTFENLVSQINSQCNQITLEYGHIINSSPNINDFPSKSFSDYDEIWILSGGSNNNDDLLIDSPTFQRFLNGILNSNANLLLGAGDGSDYHTNAITSAFGFGNLVSTNGTNTRISINPTNNDIKILTEIAKSQMRANEPLFVNVDVLADTVHVNEAAIVFSDKLVSNTNLDPLAKSSNGDAEIGRISLASRQIILEAGLGRIYNILNGDKNTRNYVINLITALRKNQ